MSNPHPNTSGLRPIQPGQALNPSGRPAGTIEFRNRCRQFMLEQGGFDILLGIAQGKGDPKDQLQAVKFLSEMGFGKPVQQIASTADDDPDFGKLKIVIERSPTPTDKQQMTRPYTDPRLITIDTESSPALPAQSMDSQVESNKVSTPTGHETDTDTDA